MFYNILNRFILFHIFVYKKPNIKRYLVADLFFLELVL